jgi:AcrR family transcriptional regulator
MVEHPLDEITVQQVLDRAGISRATFYSHFKNTDDLFLSAYEGMLNSLERHLDSRGLAERRLIAVTEFFEHTKDQRELLHALERDGRAAFVREYGIDHMARTIERRAQAVAGVVLSAVTCRMLAAALVESHRWWIDRDDRPSAAEMDATFHRLAASALHLHPLAPTP